MKKFLISDTKSNMKIVICGSIDFTEKIKEFADKLIEIGHEVEIPRYSQKIVNGDLTMEEFLKVKNERGDFEFRQQSNEDLILRYYNLINETDAILVINMDKKGIENYIGGNTFLEMGFAHVLGKKIYLYNDIPQMMYTDEIKAMAPMIILENLELIK